MSIRMGNKKKGSKKLTFLNTDMNACYIWSIRCIY